MAGLKHNQTIHISGDGLDGIYRVVLNEAVVDITVLVRLDKQSISPQGHRRSIGQLNRRIRKAPQPLCGQLLWFKTSVLTQYEQRGCLVFIELERENFKNSPADVRRLETRKKLMMGFLQIDNLRDFIKKDGGIGNLVSDAIKQHSMSKSLVYKCWSLLCRYGFSEQSLNPRYDRCGAPGIVRDCSSNGRKKPGRKTNMERLASRTGESVAPSQPGMSAVWRQLILIADKKIHAPKPRFSRRFQKILDDGFVKHFRELDGLLKPVPLKQGEYPNESQVRRVLEIEIPRLQQLLEKTTKGHYARSLRGMTGRSWKGVSGPGHTWAIDSTVADIYLRSSINRAWIIGRPIVYVIVDVWSTAIVGFYVCVNGPSWDTAKVSLFSALADPRLLGELWGYQPIITLFPLPSMPAALMCDRGEYLSYAAKETAFKLIDRMSYAPPYRPDLKGLVEVLHRITKDHQVWIPGAIDARRVELELRKFDPSTAIFTVREYTEYLHNIFAEYNLAADRKRRCDTHMIAANVVPSPAGLWRWGHEVGIGTSRHFSQSDLITSLLPNKHATVTREGIVYEKLHYDSEITTSAQWTAHARNFGSWSVPAYHFPGSVSRIWTPNMGNLGLTELTLMEQTNAAADQTFEEVEDAFAYGNLDISGAEHFRTLIRMESHHRANALVKNAKNLTALATKVNNTTKPTMSAARKLETMVGDAIPSNLSDKTAPTIIDEASHAYFEMMKNVLDVKNR